jgi:hypothetical protein
MTYKINPCGIVYEVIECDSNEVVAVFDSKKLATEYKKSLESKDSGFEGQVPKFFSKWKSV